MSTVHEILEHVAHLLPTQAPLDVFVHHNTLHAFEDLAFFEALEDAAKVFGARAYMADSWYLEAYSRGRINDHDLMDALAELGEFTGREAAEWIRAGLLALPGRMSREQVLWHLCEDHELDYPYDRYGPGKWNGAVAHETAALVRGEGAAQLRASLREETPLGWTDEDRRIADDLAEFLHTPEAHPQRRALRYLWIEALRLSTDLALETRRPADVVTDEAVDALARSLTLPLVTKVVARYLDRGMGPWKMPRAEEGFFPAVVAYLTTRTMLKPWIMEGIEEVAAEYQGIESVVAIESLLKKQAVSPEQWHERLRKETLSLKGWAGLMHRVEAHDDVVEYPRTSRSSALSDFIAAKMLIEMHARSRLMSQGAATTGAMRTNTPVDTVADRIYSRAYHIFRACQLLGVCGGDLRTLRSRSEATLLDVFHRWDEVRRGRVWHLAFEKNFQQRAFSAFLGHASAVDSARRSAARFQVVCCIDDREESFRRYLEEMGDQFETFGTAGFFGVDVLFQELGKEPAPYCPVIVTPKHVVSEVIKKDHRDRLSLSQRFEETTSTISQSFGGVPVTLRSSFAVVVGGALAFFPMILRTLFPRLSHLIENTFIHKVRLEATEVLYDSPASSVDAAEADTNFARYSLEDMAERVAGVLRAIGLVSGFADMIVFIGHGSSSKNNPFRSAYDCGACGGRPGRVNARVFALMANRPEVREALVRRGISIPDSTVFVGAYHDTCNDSVVYFDNDRLPSSHTSLLVELRTAVDYARARNADERCRRFAFATRTSEQSSLAHVEGRAHHIAEPRPEYGHATNAMCIIGRRALTRGLFLDRRAFLVSYDSSIDPEADILVGLLRAVIPVCTGINLEYFFSCLDNETYGAGSKLPLNITCLLGIITGYASDLRTGLPQQMIEIHEPVRLVTVIEAPLETVTSALQRLPAVLNFVKREWFVLGVYDATTKSLVRVQRDGSFAPWDAKHALLQETYSELPILARNSDHLAFFSVH